MAVKFVVVFMLATLAIASAVSESLAAPGASMAQRDPKERRPYRIGQYLEPTKEEAERAQKQLEAVWNKVKSWFGDEGVTTASRQKRAYYGGQYTIPTQKDVDRIQKQLEEAWNKIKSWGDEGVSTATKFQEVRNDSPFGFWDMGDEGVTLSDATKAQKEKIKATIDKIQKKLNSKSDEGITLSDATKAQKEKIKATIDKIQKKLNSKSDEGITLSDATKAQKEKIKATIDKIQKKLNSKGDEGVTTATEFQQP